MAGVVRKAAGMAGTTGRYTSIASEASRSKGAISASAGGRDRPRCRGGQGKNGWAWQSLRTERESGGDLPG